MWSLNYAGTDYSFPKVAVTSVQVEGRVYRVADTPNPNADGIRLGEDFADPGDIKLKLLINFSTVRNLDLQREMLNEAAESFLLAWDAPALRAIPNAVGELTIPSLGSFEGRPRRAEWDYSTFGLGYLIGTATFIRSDLSTFISESEGGGWREASVALVPPTTGGWVFPLVFPVSNLNPARRGTHFEVGGTVPAAAIVEIAGPIQAGAELELVGEWTVRTKQALAYDQTARADARNGRMLLTVNGQPSNWMAPSSARLSQLRLPPGDRQIALRGTSIEGTAHARVRWRDTKAGI